MCQVLLGHPVLWEACVSIKKENYVQLLYNKNLKCFCIKKLEQNCGTCKCSWVKPKLCFFEQELSPNHHKPLFCDQILSATTCFCSISVLTPPWLVSKTRSYKWVFYINCTLRIGKFLWAINTDYQFRSYIKLYLSALVAK